MLIKINFIGGPQNGTVEFDYSPMQVPGNAPPSVSLAHSFYALSEGKVGAGTTGATPAAYALLLAGDERALKNLEEKSMTYFVTERKEEGGRIIVTAEYKSRKEKAN